MIRLKNIVAAWPRLAVFIVAAVFGFAIETDQAYTDDARFYVPAAEAYGEWLEAAAVGAVTLDSAPFSRQRLDATFAQNHEHPPVGKYVMAISWLLFHRATGLLTDVAACRVGVTLLWAMMVALVFGLVRSRRGALSGLFAALALVFMPRVLFDAHAETLDLPVAAFLTLAATAALEHLEQPRFMNGVGAVVAFALALGTKHNAPFFLVALFAYWLLLELPHIRDVELRLRPIPVMFPALVAVSPLLVLAVWPWLWFDTMPRVTSYVQYRLHHYGIYFYYLGRLYGDDVAPWHAPWLLTALTVPVCVLVLALFGVVASLAAYGRRFPRLEKLTRCGPSIFEDPGARLGLFSILQVVAQLGAISLPGVPIYGGVKLFLPVFPFLAILAGLGAARLFQEIDAQVTASALRRRVKVLSITLALLPGVVGVLAYRGVWLSYYNELAGGARGAAAAGHERQYYDLAYPALARDLIRLMPNGGGLAVLANPKEYGPYLDRWQKEGRVPAGVRLLSAERADMLVLTHESRWREYPELMARYRALPILSELSIAGVPLYTIFDVSASHVQKYRSIQ